MNSPAEIATAMAAVGCSAEHVAAVLSKLQNKSSGAARQARYRARKASLNVTSDVTSDVTESSLNVTSDAVSRAPIRERVLNGSLEEEIDTSSLRSEGANAPIDPDADLFRRGREILGPKAGGQIAKLKALYGGDVAKTRSLIEECAVKDRPAEYAAAVLRKHGPQARDGPPLNGSHSAKPMKTNLFIQAAIESQEDADRARQARSFDPTER